MKKLLSISAAILLSATFLISCTKSNEPGSGSTNSTSASISSAAGGTALDLSTFINAEKNYQYNTLKWESSVDTVEKTVPYAIEKSPDGPIGDESVAVYKSKDQFDLEGQKANASFEFKEDKLQMVTFDFTLSDDYEEWFAAQTAQLTKLYGDCTDSMGNQNDKLGSKGYKWETPTSTLQIILVTSKNSAPAATIGVALKSA